MTEDQTLSLVLAVITGLDTLLFMYLCFFAHRCKKISTQIADNHVRSRALLSEAEEIWANVRNGRLPLTSREKIELLTKALEEGDDETATLMRRDLDAELRERMSHGED